MIAYAADFDSVSATTATCFGCRKGPAEPDIDRNNTNVVTRAVKQGQISCWEDTMRDLPEQGEHHR